MDINKDHNNHGSLKRSFKYAFNGLISSFKKERTFQIQIFLATVVIIVGFIFSIESNEWLAIIISIGVVLSLELVNTQVERLIDYLHPEHHPEIGRIKDVMAAAVLISSLSALAVAGIVFIPKFLYI